MHDGTLERGRQCVKLRKTEHKATFAACTKGRVYDEMSDLSPLRDAHLSNRS